MAGVRPYTTTYIIILNRQLPYESARSMANAGARLDVFHSLLCGVTYCLNLARSGFSDALMYAAFSSRRYIACAELKARGEKSDIEKRKSATMVMLTTLKLSIMDSRNLI
jgi:hypothetical protein